MTDRVPKIGDVIRTATPMQTDSLTYRAGDYLYAKLSSQAALDFGRELVASGRWVIVDPQPQEKPGPNNESSNQ